MGLVVLQPRKTDYSLQIKASDPIQPGNLGGGLLNLRQQRALTILERFFPWHESREPNL